MQMGEHSGHQISDTQKGAAAEDLVATQLIVRSGGGLSPFTPVADDMGIDLLVYDKKTGRSLPFQVKSRTKTLWRSPNIVHFEVRMETLNDKQDAYPLAILVAGEAIELTVTRAWLIPMRKLRSVAASRKEKLVIRPSQSPNSKDRFSPYRCEDMGEVVRRLLSEFGEP